MKNTFDKTVKDKRFEKTFVEVPCSGRLNSRDNSQLRLFRLHGIVDRNFDINSLRHFISLNIGSYIFTRAKYNKYVSDDEIEMIGSDAIDEIRKNRKPDEKGTGTEIGEIMLYIFLESILNAPKLYSKIELASGGKDSAADSIHILLTEDNDNKVSYEMVFGSSSVIGDLGDAIDQAFDQVAKIKQNSKKEVSLVDESIFDLPNNSPEIPFLEELINNPQGLNVTKNTAYGLFLGFSLGLNKHRTDDEYMKYINSKINDEILHYLPQIKKKISDLELRDHSFYIYVFPFDDAEKDKKTVMKTVMKEGVQDE